MIKAIDERTVILTVGLNPVVRAVASIVGANISNPLMGASEDMRNRQTHPIARKAGLLRCMLPPIPMRMPRVRIAVERWDCWPNIDSVSEPPSGIRSRTDNSNPFRGDLKWTE